MDKKKLEEQIAAVTRVINSKHTAPAMKASMETKLSSLEAKLKELDEADEPTPAPAKKAATKAKPVAKGKKAKAEPKVEANKKGNKRGLKNKAMTPEQRLAFKEKMATLKAAKKTPPAPAKPKKAIPDAIKDCKDRIKEYNVKHRKPRTKARVSFTAQIATSSAGEFKRLLKHTHTKTDKDVKELVGIYKQFLTDIAKFAGEKSKVELFMEEIDSAVEKITKEKE